MPKEGPSSGKAVLAAFIPAFVAACLYLTVFIAIRNSFRRFYAPRTFLGAVPQKHRTPASHASGTGWFHDFRTLPDRFIFQHNSLDAYLYLRFLRFIVWILFLGTCLTWPILLPINSAGGKHQEQLDKLSFSNIDKNNLLWAHLVIAWVFFIGVFCAIAWERLQLVGIRQACYINDSHKARLSARTVLFLNAPHDSLLPENLQKTFGEDAERSWPVRRAGELADLVAKRDTAAFSLESAEYDLIVKAVKRQKKNQSNGVSRNGSADEETQALVPRSQRPSGRQPPVVGDKFDAIEHGRRELVEFAEKVDALRADSQPPIPGQSAVFVAFNSQEAAHRAYQEITFQPRIPLKDRFLAVQPKEVLWDNLARPMPERLSKASLALVFVIVFTIFFSIPVGLIGTLSNAEKLADSVSFLSWLKDLPDWLLGLLVGFVPPFLTSLFVSYVSYIFRYIAKLAGEPTVPQAELKTQAWFFVFQVIQVFLVTTVSSGVAAVASSIAQDPASTPALLASKLPQSANFYITYFVLQGLGSAASNVLNYTDLMQYLFYEYVLDKTPREKFNTYAQMKGTPWATWYPKFANFFVIAVVYSCIAPLVTGFAAMGIYLYYLSYRYSLLYVRQTKIDTKGEGYKRALQQLPTALYFAELCMIGLFGAREAPAQTTLMIVLLVLTAVANLLLDRVLKPLDLYLGVDKWQAEQVPLLADEEGIPHDDEAALHAAAHGRRLGLSRLPNPAPRVLSNFFDSIISRARFQIKQWLDAADTPDEATELSEEDLAKAYLAPVFTSKTPKIWIPSDQVGVSKQEQQEDEAAGLQTTSQGAEIDENGKLHWDHNFENVPIYSKPKII